METCVKVRMNEYHNHMLEVISSADEHGKYKTEPLVVTGTVRSEETSNDYDWDTFYPNEVESYTNSDVPDDEYDEVIIIFYPDGCRIIPIPESFFDN